MPFDESRRLTGSNLYFADAGAVLEVVGVEVDRALLDGWDERVVRACASLGWPDGARIVRTHAGGASLAFAAPVDQLLCATEVNEWALASSVTAVRNAPDERPPARRFAPGHAATWDEASALHTLAAQSREERRADLRGLVDAGRERGLTVLIDEETLSIGAGTGVRGWAMAALPAARDVDWASIHDVPTVLVTGSNGKTTTVRLIAAILRAHGWCSGYSCTDGLFVDGIESAGGDYSGPAGARAVLRDPRVEAAVLETARGGILRRGIAVQRADVAVVTNVSDDHFGEYGIHDLAGLADVKLAVARTLDADGLLVLNADDALLVAGSARLDCPLAWFAQDADAPRLQAHRAGGGATAGVRDGELWLAFGGAESSLGAIRAMPLTFAGAARYNVANVAAAVLAAARLGVAPTVMAQVLERFGAAHADNPGRLQHWSIAGIEVFVDYAHNPDGLRGLLRVATARSTGGRLGLLLGQAGNRDDAEIRELAAVAMAFEPQLIVLKELPAMLRGRAIGDVPALLRDELAKRGFDENALLEHLDEDDAARAVLTWARSGDIVVLPIHSSAARRSVSALLDAMARGGWRACTPLPPL